MHSNNCCLLHSVMQFKYFSEALLARLGADFPSQYQLEIVHYTSLGAGKELESFPLQTPGYKYRAFAGNIGSGSGSGGARSTLQRSRLYK